MAGIHSEKVLILDFGSQYTQLIARRVREVGVYSEIHPFDINEQTIKAFNPKAVILSGGPESVMSPNSFGVPDIVFNIGVPVLGICYGMQIMAKQLGGQVSDSKLREFGYAQIRIQGHSSLLVHIQDDTHADGHALLDVWMSHSDRVETVPNGFDVIASTDNSPIAGMADDVRKFYGLQFHPEVTHTKQGQAILKRFLYEIAGCNLLWTTDNIVKDMITRVKEQVGNDKVLLALSGGVDSSVVAALLHEIIGDQLVCVFIDNGLLRLHESEQVMETFTKHMGIKVICIDAERRFLSQLKGVTDPEEKRKIIGREFIHVFEEHAYDVKGIDWLAQGTIYPDVIESAGAKTGKAHVIKSHHNVGGLPDIIKLKLIEPLRELFKDEVRRLGIRLGLPKEMINRHPFPGPGLGVRILGEIKKEYADILRKADHIFIEELRTNNLYDQVSQAFVVFLPVKSVGVMGDARKYDYVVSLRAVATVDFMTAHWAHLPYDFLEHVSGRIINEIDGISRVTYDISGKPPATIEWE